MATVAVLFLSKYASSLSHKVVFLKRSKHDLRCLYRCPFLYRCLCCLFLRRCLSVSVCVPCFVLNWKVCHSSGKRQHQRLELGSRKLCTVETIQGLHTPGVLLLLAVAVGMLAAAAVVVGRTGLQLPAVGMPAAGTPAAVAAAVVGRMGLQVVVRMGLPTLVVHSSLVVLPRMPLVLLTAVVHMGLQTLVARILPAGPARRRPVAARPALALLGRPPVAAAG